MKKTLALVLMLASLSAFSTTVFAENTTTLTTTVPDATYTLNIPADQEITFGATDTNIGNITVTESTGFADGKNLNVTVTYDHFKCEDVATTIPYKFGIESEKAIGFAVDSGNYVTFAGKVDGSVSEKAYLADDSNMLIQGVAIRAKSEDWGKALAGNYSTTITFTSEVVVSE